MATFPGTLAERRGLGGAPLELVAPAIQAKPILPSPQRSKLAMSIPTPKFAFGRTIFIEKVKVRAAAHVHPPGKRER